MRCRIRLSPFLSLVAFLHPSCTAPSLTSSSGASRQFSDPFTSLAKDSVYIPPPGTPGKRRIIDSTILRGPPPSSFKSWGQNFVPWLFGNIPILSVFFYVLSFLSCAFFPHQSSPRRPQVMVFPRRAEPPTNCHPRVDPALDDSATRLPPSNAPATRNTCSPRRSPRTTTKLFSPLLLRPNLFSSSRPSPLFAVAASVKIYLLGCSLPSPTLLPNGNPPHPSLPQLFDNLADDD